MLCPHCKKEMIVIERNNVELDYCLFCEGFWFDRNEWNILCKKLISESIMDNESSIFNIPVALANEKQRICPVCSKKMEKFILFDVLLDRCPKKCGIWFDKNEFSSCVNAVKANRNNQEINFLGEVFSK